jgi:cytochrome d ubiquinol oxidase subunit I
MNYPVWEIPALGGPWVIGLIAIFHVFISHFAVGGGLYLALSEQLAFQRQDNRMYAYLKDHSKFFLLLTSVAGAVSGVGIWWSISLVNPSGTHSLIQTFTLGWACEYLFFVAELATIFVYYYTWDRLDRKTHLKLAQWYGLMSVMTLVIINGILTYMLTPSTWIQSKYWLEGFFNETYWPSLFIRLIMMMAIAGMYALITASRIQHDESFREKMLKYAAKWFIPIFLLGPLFAFWYFCNLPQDALDTVFTGIQASGIGNFSIMARSLYLSLFLSGTILVFVFVGPYLNPRGFSFKMALLFATCALIVTGITEYSRELLRKPYVIYGYMYSNGLIRDQIPMMNQTGVVANHPWLKALLKKQSGEVQALISAPGRLREAKISKNPHLLGKAMFTAQCMSCHTERGYRSMSKLLADRDKKAIGLFLESLHQTEPKKNPYSKIMPPLVGTEVERKALAEYLYTINHPEQKSLATASAIK